jgi:uncharacterized membrane protein YfcA
MRSLLVPLFLSFRLVYIPATILSHSEHGGIWVNLALALLLAFGGEWLGRRSRRSLGQPAGLRTMLIITLIFIGFFPEEAPVALLLWLGSGVAWGHLTREQSYDQDLAETILGAGLGFGLGLLGLFGPASWLMALALLMGIKQQDQPDPVL